MSDKNIKEVKKIDISVIIPIYNVDKYLKECLDSLTNQTLKSIEIICINDGSTDKSLEILNEYVNKDNRFILINQENKGQSIARNIGVSMAKGEYLYFMDSDDWIESVSLEKLYNTSKSKDLDVLLFGARSFFEYSTLQDEFPYMTDNYKITIETDKTFLGINMFEQLVLNSQYYASPVLKLIKRSFYKYIGISFYPNIIHEDELFSFKLLLQAKKVSCITDRLYNRRIREDSVMTTKYTYKNFEGVLTCYLEMLLFYKSNKYLHANQNLFRNFFITKRLLCTNIYLSAIGKNIAKVEETLTNIEHLILGYSLIEFIGEDEFIKNRNSYSELCFFGAGEEGGKALRFFENKNLKLPLAICDNNKHLHSSYLNEIPIISFDTAISQYDDIYIIITNKKFYHQILQQVENELDKFRILYVSVDW